MKINIVKEAGYEIALEGISLSYKQPIANMEAVSRKIFNKEDGSNKFLESIILWIDIVAPRYWWIQMDSYRVGITKQSEATLHSIMNKQVTIDNFEGNIPRNTIERLNQLISENDLYQLKRELPEAFLQRRIICTNYLTLRRIIRQRRKEYFKEWNLFITEIYKQVDRPEYLVDII